MATIKITNNRYTAEALYQWDKNQTLEIYGLSLPSVPKIHFTNNSLGGAIVRQSTMSSDGVIRVGVPNSLLQKPYRITAYVCVYEGDSFASQYEINIPVRERQRPADYSLEADDEEIYSFTKLEKLVNDSLKTMSDSVNRVEKKADELEDEFNSGVEALVIATSKNRAHVFNTTEDMRAWLSNATNAGVCRVGDNLYIVDIDVPDWWVSEVLTTADADTGYYYKIAQLETQKVDLSKVLQIVSFDADSGTLVTKSPDYVIS